MYPLILYLGVFTYVLVLLCECRRRSLTGFQPLLFDRRMYMAAKSNLPLQGIVYLMLEFCFDYAD